MQLFARKSEEGESIGLGWVDAEVFRFKFDDKERHLKIPHMGGIWSKSPEEPFV